MSLADNLAAIARGERPEDDALLGTCRLEWGGTERFGEEDILEAFRGAPLDLDSGSLVVCLGAALWISETEALAADLYDGRVGRLWRLGKGALPLPEPALWVPFDTDLSQERASLLWRAEDHPWLAAPDADRAETLARRVISPHRDFHRIRGYVLRAFSADGRVALLACRYRLSAGETRAACFGFVAGLAAPHDERIVEDAEPPPQWVMRL